MWSFNNPDFPIESFITIHDECPIGLGHYILDAVAHYYDDLNSESEVISDDLQEIC